MKKYTYNSKQDLKSHMETLVMQHYYIFMVHLTFQYFEVIVFMVADSCQRPT